MNAITPLFLAVFLSACVAIQKPEPEIKRAQPKPQEIQIQTAPPGALVDWNGNVLGVAPITIELTPSFSQWPDGAINTEFFESDTPPPQAIAIVSPSVGNYRDIWTTPAKKELQIKKGP
ncbi:MAG: hypothetical protein EBY32_13740 [Proteobacteria bacterium]|nr:hypothetical protein [Pseudomonadota bacterium]